MKKFFFASLCIGILFFVYAYHKTAVFILAYTVEAERQNLEKLSDEKSQLLYNLHNKISLKKFSNQIESDFVCGRYFVALTVPEATEIVEQVPNKQNKLIARLSKFAQQAEAKPE